MDARCIFTKPVYLTEKAVAMAKRLCWLLANIGGLRGNKRHIMTSVVNSGIPYKAKIWSPPLKSEKIPKKLVSLQRDKEKRPVERRVEVAEIPGQE